MPKISVIIPVYNTEKYLEKCLSSVLNQTYCDLEIIIVNDGSTDNSELIIKEYETKYPDKIKYYKKENSGLSDTRNYGVKKATGEYLCFLDSDDYLDTKLFEKLKIEIEKQTEVIKYKTIIVDSKYNELEKADGPVFESVSGQEAFNRLVFRDSQLETACLYLYNKEYYTKNNFKYELGLYHEDFGLTPIIIIKAKTVSSLSFYGYYYYQGNDSIMRTEDYEKTKKKAWDVLIHYDNMINIIDNDSKINKNTKDNIKQYYTNSILLKAKELNDDDLNSYINEIKKRNMIKNIKIKNIKQLLKRMILMCNIKAYIKLI